MLTPPADLDPARLRALLLGQWPLGTDDLSLVYLPVGFGSHHWAATAPDGRRWFVTADDHRAARSGTHLAAGPEELDRSLALVTTLRGRDGLEFAHGPRRSVTGRAALPAGDTGWTISVFDHLDAEPIGTHGEIPSGDREAVLRMLGRLHAIPVAAAAGLRTFDFAIGDRDGLLAALDDSGSWATGPYAGPVRELLARHGDRIRRALAAHDRRVAGLLADRSGWVITHGELHGGNILRDRSGELYLVDWGSVAIGPPERDLAGIPGAGPDDDWTAYLAAGGRVVPTGAGFHARQLWWDPNDLAEFVGWFRTPHDDTPEIRVAWDAIQSMLPLSDRFLAGD